MVGSSLLEGWLPTTLPRAMNRLEGTTNFIYKVSFEISSELKRYQMR